MEKKYYTYTLNTMVLNVIALLILFVFVIINYAFFDINILDIKICTLVIMTLWLILHEVIHAIGFLLSFDVKRSNVVFGMFLEKGIFYCMCKQEISKKSILFSLLLPLITIGIITLIVGYIISSPLLVLLSIINISGCAGDIMMWFFMMRLPNDVRYLDLDDPTSFTMISDKDLSGVKVLGIELKDSGIYDSKKMYARDKSRIKISNLSWVFLIILCILYIIDLLI
ncbi:MAG: DUF3267 domain-containing protein [Bacilli bacterium]|nr:DUF3267 domain-containing protein [Bacilli bacterium]